MDVERHATLFKTLSNFQDLKNIQDLIVLSLSFSPGPFNEDEERQGLVLLNWYYTDILNLQITE